MPFDARVDLTVRQAIDLLPPFMKEPVQTAISELMEESPLHFPYGQTEHEYVAVNGCSLTFHWLNAEVVMITRFSWRKE